MFKEVSSKVDFPALEREILRFWAQTQAFQKLVAKNQHGPRWSFIDGPITANNPMGVHHAWGRTYKDLWHRFKAMQGYRTRYQNGFDCQGLWVEVNVERDLKFASKRDIEAYGIERFVRQCKQRVLEYAAVQTEQSIRLGFWMDWNDPAVLRDLYQKLGEDPGQTITVPGPLGPVTGTVEQVVGKLGTPALGGSYFTFADENNYSIWMFLRRCHDHGWIYKGTDVMPWCPRCGTGLSEHEIATEGYEELTHTSVFLKFPLLSKSGEAVQPGESLLVWTTTPWTLTSNVAAAVHPDLPYAQVRQGNESFWLSKGAVFGAIKGPYQIVAERPGSELVGWTYRGPFDELPPQASIVHRVIPWKEVGEEEGTGIVHIAPGCGKEDFQLSKQFGLAVIAPIDEFGVFVDGFGWLTGQEAGPAAPAIFDDLQRKGLLYRLEDYTHRYPVCWRCHEELLFRLVDEWFIRMDELRYQIMDVVRQIRWIPAFGQERELDWLRNMSDWMISKKRYWGLALPIWECPQCGHFEVIGSEVELQQRAVEGWETFAGHTPHRPWIDAVKIRCPQCGEKVARIKDVGNPWLDAGIVPFSTLRYRHDRPYWAEWFPADFVTESFPGQFRNWFYSLLAMSTALENKPPFLTVLGYETVLDDGGRMMHKSSGNMIEFNEAADKAGVDVMRWAYAGQQPESDMLFGYRLMDEVRRRFILPLWNVYSFFVTYANLDGWQPGSKSQISKSANRQSANRQIGKEDWRSPLDKWLLSELQVLIQKVTAGLDDYDAMNPAKAVEVFVDSLANWYIRRSRRRFWKTEDDADKQAAYATLYECLVTLSKLLAPFLPFLTEAMYQNLVRSVDSRAPESVHHCAWPQADPALIDEGLMADIRLVREVVSLGRAARQKARLKVRQPLPQVLVRVKTPAERAALERLSDQVLDELNVKSLAFVSDDSELISYQVKPAFGLLGPKYGKLVPAIKAALEKMDPAMVAHKVLGGGRVAVPLDGETLHLESHEVEVRTLEKPGYATAEEEGYLVGVDIAVTPELEREGLARELVRHVQEARKNAGFRIDDRIVLGYQASPKVTEAFAAYGPYIQQDTLSVALQPGPLADAYTEYVDIEGEAVTLYLRRHS